MAPPEDFGRPIASRQEPAADPIALVAAAVEVYRLDAAVATAAFHAGASRGRPTVTATSGHRCLLRYRGLPYPLQVFHTGPTTYRVESAGAFADVMVELTHGLSRRLRVAGRTHDVIAAVDGPVFRIDVDGAEHTLIRDDGEQVCSEWPALVVSVSVRPGDLVSKGDPLLVLESMKLETTIVAAYDAEIASVEVLPHGHVEPGTPLLRLRPGMASQTRGDGSPVRLDGLAEPRLDVPPYQAVYAALISYLLGYDLDPAAVREMLERHSDLGRVTRDNDPGLLSCEDDLLDLFADTAHLWRPRTESTPAQDASGAPQEFLLAFLQWLDPEQAGLPDRYRERLIRAFRRYGVVDLEHTPALEEASVLLFRSFGRVDQLTNVVAAILYRRLAQHEAIAPLLASAQPAAAQRARLDRLAAAAQGRHQTVADLARDVRFRYLDQPLLTTIIDAEYARVDELLTGLRSELDPTVRDRHMQRLVESPQPLRGVLLGWWLTGDDDLRRLILQLHTRRYYRRFDPATLHVECVDGHLICSAAYQEADGAINDAGVTGRRLQVVTAYASWAELPALSHAMASYLSHHGRVDDSCAGVVVDLTTWRGEPAIDRDVLADMARDLLARCDFGRPLWRLDLTVTSGDGAAAEYGRPRHFSYRQTGEQHFVEEPLYRDLHPMLAERLELWRLANFDLERLATAAEDIYLFRGVSRENSADQRLFALAEVRDLTPVVDADGSVTYPRLELLGLLALAAMRRAIAASFPARRYSASRLILYVRPVWTIDRAAWSELARSLAPLAVGAGLQKVVLRVRIPTPDGWRDSVLHVEGLGRRGVTVRERMPEPVAVRSLTPYRQKVLRAERVGAPYPYEIIRMLAPPHGVLGRFPAGSFVEYDLDSTGTLVEIHRMPGLNTANIVVGLITNHTVKVPEGMTRVALLGDPTRGLGNLAEPECRRIIGGLDLAERLGVPVEWFAVSSGARIAMDSGTENMDWIAAVLRRLVEFTQRGREVNIVVTGVNVGAQPYWNAEATMLMHTKGILVMTPRSAMVLTGKQALDFSGGVSADDNLGIGGFDRVMGPNGQAQYWAPTVEDACEVLLRHYDHSYIVTGERSPRRAATADPITRDVCLSPHSSDGADQQLVGAIFSTAHNHQRKKPFEIRAVLRAVTDTDSEPLERWQHWRGAEMAVVWDAHIGGIPVCLLGLESSPLPRRGYLPADGPPTWTSGTLFPQSSRKFARAINAASANRPVVVLANLAGFDGSPESMRHWQLEYGAEIGRAVTNFLGPMIFVVISRYHGGAFVVFSKRLNPRLEIAAVVGSFASVIGGAPAAATVFAREVNARTEQDPGLRTLQEQLHIATADAVPGLRRAVAERSAVIRSHQLAAVADEFDAVHTIERALRVGSVDRIIAAHELRPYLVDALERGLAVEPASVV